MTNPNKSGAIDLESTKNEWLTDTETFLKEIVNARWWNAKPKSKSPIYFFPKHRTVPNDTRLPITNCDDIIW